MPRSLRSAIPSFLALLCLTAQTYAQQAPIGASAGAANRDGAAGGDRVSFNLPAERHGIPVPLSLSFGGGTEVGSGGVGWNLGLSSIAQNNTFSRQRPRAMLVGGAPEIFAADDPNRGRATLTLLGQSYTLVPIGGAGAWRALVGGATIEANKSNDVWSVTDGSGRRYRFEKLAALGDPARWYLTEIRTGHDAQSKMVLQYNVQTVTTGGITAPELVLQSLQYNFDAAGSCPKNEVKLVYGAPPELPAGALLAAVIDQAFLQVRTRLLTGVQVFARGATCGAAAKSLSRYELVYAPDVDSRQPRLVAVNAFGAAGTAEAAMALPLGRYRYGRTSSYGFGGKGPTTEPQLVYGERAARALPPGQTDLGQTFGSSGAGFDYATHGMLLDLDADGLLDFVTNLQWFQNRGDVFLNAMSMFTGLATTPSALTAQTTRAPRNRYPRSPNQNGTGFEETWLAVIDMNHDGRPDIIDAYSVPGYWRLYLNRSDGWQSFTMDMSVVHDRLRPRLGVGTMVPPTRSATGTPGILKRCLTSPDATNWIPCPDVASSFEVRPQITNVEWQLRDVNGDGYPDLVANSLRTSLRKVGDECAPILASAPWQFEPGTGVYCDESWNVVYLANEDERDNHLMVFLNTAGARLGSQSPFADWIPLTTTPSCSVEQYRSIADELRLSEAEPEDDIKVYGAIKLRGSRQECGFVELNGDGIADRVESTREGPRASLGTGIGYVGVPELVLPDRAALNETATDYYDVCRDPKNPARPGQEYNTRGVRGLIDVNGDGLADYWDGVTVSLGTGAGFAAPIAIASTLPAGDPGIALSESIGNCEGTKMRTTGGLFDLDGDGRLDYLRVEGSSLRSFSLFEPTGGWGALASGRITERENGYGRIDHFRYESLKGRLLPGHQIPSPEIVLSESWTTHGAGATGPDVDPTRYGYLGAQLWFDSLADRWRFYGYERVVALQGRDDDGDGLFSGIAVLSDAYRPGDAVAGLWENQYLGRPRRTTVLAGSLSFNPNSYAADATLYDQWRAQSDWSYGAAVQPLSGYTNATDDCLSAPQPYPPMAFAASDGDLDPPCRTRVDVYERVAQDREGKGAPTADRFLEQRDTVLEVDTYARPTMIYHSGDTHRDDDDWCEKRVYAVPQTSDRVLTRTASVQRLLPPSKDSCGGATLVLAGAHARYDGLPEGVVTIGLATHSIAERRDPATGALLDQFTTQQIAYDGRGNPTTFWRENGTGLAQTTTVGTYDAFGLRATAIDSSAVGSPTVFQRRFQYDPYSLLLTESTNAKGVSERSQYDGYGRLQRSTQVDPRDGIETVRSLAEYFGQTVVGAPPLHASESSTDVIDPMGTRFRVRTFADRTLPTEISLGAATPGRKETWRTHWFDYLGRKRFTELQLGDDYQGKSLIAEERSYDGRGLVTFEAAAYVAGTAAPHYGTTYFHAPSGEVTCRVLATPAPFLFPTTSVPDGRFAACTDEQFGQFQRTTVAAAPDDLDPTSSSWGASSQTISDARGRTLRQRRLLGTTVLERTDYEYDRLSQPRLTRRYADPAATQAVEWIADYDSLGRRMRFAEPGTAARSQTFNRAGLITETWWMDGANRRSLRTRYDGFGRPTGSIEAKNGVEDAASATSYAYDRTSGEAFHRDTEYAIGDLTFASNAAQKYYGGYDPFGRTTFEAWVDSAGRRVEHSSAFRPDGQPTEMHWKLPDSVADEMARFEYDSAQRLKVVTWMDEANTGRELFRAATTDPLGRVRSVKYGNGVTASRTYRDAQRDELLGYSLVSPSSGTLAASFQYDGNGRIGTRIDAVSSTSRNETTTYRYDGAGRLGGMATLSASNATVQRESYRYDGLGNLLALDDQVGTRSFTAVPDSIDRDRLCRVTGPGYPPTEACTFSYDVLGAVTNAPLGLNGAMRTTTYDGRGRTKSMAAQLTTATWQYGPLGDVVVSAMVGAENRTSVSFGARAEWNESSVAQGRFDRVVPAGDVTVRKEGTGAKATFLYSHAESRGARAVFDRAGKLVHELDYRPFGGARIDTAVPGAATYETAQWNGGEAFGPLAVNRLGARMYEPRLGRFLSRDPLVLDGSSSKSHPYAFAYNDPINRTDPSGMQPPGCAEWDCLGGPVTVAAAIMLIAGSGIASFLDHITTPDPDFLGGNYPNLSDAELRLRWMDAALAAYPPKQNVDTRVGEFFMHLTPPGHQRFYMKPPSELARQRACQPGHGADCLAAEDEYLAARATYALKPWADFADAWGTVIRAMMGDVDMPNVLPGGDGDSMLPPPRLGALPKWFLKRELKKLEKEEAEQFEKKLERELVEEGESCIGGSCFVGSTLVHTADGPRPIATIAIGDWVWAEDPETGETTLRRVLHTSIRFDEPLWAVALDDGQGGIETLEVTREHPFWTQRGWRRVDELAPSDEIEHRAGWWSKVFEARETAERAPVYNLIVDGLHTYFVGGSGVLVHNGCPCPAERGFWEATAERTSARANHKRFGTFFQHDSTGLWWSRDRAGHGGSVWKVFSEGPRGLNWIADADEFGDFIVGKHKGPTGLSIPWSELF